MDPGAANKLSFPLPIDAPREIWLRLVNQFWRKISLKIVNDNGRTDAGAWVY